MGLVMGLGLLHSVDSLRYHGKSGIWLEVVGVDLAIDLDDSMPRNIYDAVIF